MSVTLHTGDCLDVLRGMADSSVDSVVTDPPYGLGFMGKAWDGSVPSVEVWAECLRVLKPGGHILAFAGTRTQHRMAVAIEDAGFEIRDLIAWLYGSGFPKSHDVAKAIDKASGTAGEVVPSGAPVKRIIPGADQNKTGSWIKDSGRTYQPGEYVPGCEDAAHWQGWGTALKPALEPITVARKPLDGTVAKNVLAHGTGALNIDGCRVDVGARPFREIDPKASANGSVYAGRRESGGGFDGGSRASGETAQGRWPANVIHDGSDEVLACFPDAPGRIANASTRSEARKMQNVYGAMRSGRGDEPSANSENQGGVGFKMRPGARRGDTGTAARFFYCAKASKADRGDGLGDLRNMHPTVKPTDLMRYLCRLVTPPGGTVLDPFMGTGSTGRGAVMEGFAFIGIDAEAEYVEIARARIAAAERRTREEAEAERRAAEDAARQPDLFQEGAG